MFVGFLAYSFATIANFQWFSKLPSPLNGMVEGNHWDQWFFDGFGVRQPLVTMVFDGCAPLVRRWNGYVPSSKSSHKYPGLSFQLSKGSKLDFLQKDLTFSKCSKIFKIVKIKSVMTIFGHGKKIQFSVINYDKKWRKEAGEVWCSFHSYIFCFVLLNFVFAF